MICLLCEAVVDDCWRWCPECGGPVVDRDQLEAIRSGAEQGMSTRELVSAVSAVGGFALR